MIFDLVLCAAALGMTTWDYRRHRAGQSQRPWWIAWLCVALAFAAFAFFAPMGRLPH